ncbi:hypothetical protein AUEXF2481DRAFT_44880 [Aureobasidium subglaciale EXF-2481]|uniref:Uncharacterized protein n=1 Tax=Aureobasidium subglaciale (strain EXF-2481) TaxID=1043005 RepID=A0A074YV16_AURSE|nr:uncharacterized protein AUEXF2481DRAFT_44880 [Aureobasidium subglaciale EXF-2481]KEQ90681.1 hypothetical protein AUEXF2481DRAFT_44880 [Aureobasidium subglaciale EXF-2481]
MWGSSESIKLFGKQGHVAILKIQKRAGDYGSSRTWTVEELKQTSNDTDSANSFLQKENRFEATQATVISLCAVLLIFPSLEIWMFWSGRLFEEPVQRRYGLQSAGLTTRVVTTVHRSNIEPRRSSDDRGESGFGIEMAGRGCAAGRHGRIQFILGT